MGDVGPTGVGVVMASYGMPIPSSSRVFTTSSPSPVPQSPSTAPVNCRVPVEWGSAGYTRRLISWFALLSGARSRWHVMAAAGPAELALAGGVLNPAGGPRAISHDEERTVLTPTRPRTRLAPTVPSSGPEAPCHTLENGATTSTSASVPSDVRGANASKTMA